MYERGTRVAGQHLVLFVMPGSTGQARVGLTATRKVGGAVVRNRARRLIREAFRRHPDAFDAWDLVVNVRASAATRSAAEIERELLGLAQRARRALAAVQRGKATEPAAPDGNGPRRGSDA